MEEELEAAQDEESRNLNVVDARKTATGCPFLCNAVTDRRWSQTVVAVQIESTLAAQDALELKLDNLG